MAGLRRVIFPRRVNPWPGHLLFLEPEWEMEDCGEGRWKIVPRRWLYLLTSTGWSRDAVEGVIETREKMCEFLALEAARNSPLTVISHSMAVVLILLNLSNFFPKIGWWATRVFKTDDRFIAETTDGIHIIRLYDLQNWVNGPLHEIAGWVESESTEFQRFSPLTPQTYARHCDTLFLVSRAWDRYRDWVEKNSLGGFTQTISGISFGVFSRSSQAREVIRSKDVSVLKKERLAFHGGFCRAHKTGFLNTVSYYLLDANGLYASVEREENLPCRFISSVLSPTSRQVDRVGKYGQAIIHGVFSSTEGYLPVHEGNHLSWRQEEVDCWLPWPEFKWIVTHGVVHKIHELLLYQTSPIFRETVTPWIAEAERCRSEGKKFEKRLWKMLCNSLYGKLGQRFGRTHLFPLAEGEEDGSETCYSAKTGATAQIERWCGSKLVTFEDDHSDSNFPAIPAFVTSHARVRLFQWNRRAGWDHTIYNDTDSMIVDATGYDRLKGEIDGVTTGRLRLEDQGSPVYIGGPKQYKIGTHYVDGSSPRFHVATRDGGLMYSRLEPMTGKNSPEYGAIFSRVEFKKSLRDLDEFTIS